MFGLAWWKSATIWFHTSSSAGSPHIIMLISTGALLAAGGFVPPQAASRRLAVTRTNRNVFMFLSFLEIQFDHCCQVVGAVGVQSLGQRAMEGHQLEDRQVQDGAHAFRDSRLKADIRVELAETRNGCALRF